MSQNVSRDQRLADDAEAICEAVGRPNMRFVPIKSAQQQNIQALHRIRSGLVQERTAKANRIRGLLGEYGIVFSARINVLRKALPEVLEDGDNGLLPAFRSLLEGLRQDLVYLDERVSELDRSIEQLAREHADASRLMSLRGVGPITATALVAALGDGSDFKRGRDVSAWAGLVPGQHSSGGKERLLGISKRGDAYLRTLLIHGARAVIQGAKDKQDGLSRWIQSLCHRRNKNIAAVALANKTLRMAWALLRTETEYQADYAAGRPA